MATADIIVNQKKIDGQLLESIMAIAMINMNTKICATNEYVIRWARFPTPL